MSWWKLRGGGKGLIGGDGVGLSASWVSLH